jgi:hypothetical protein
MREILPVVHISHMCSETGLRLNVHMDSTFRVDSDPCLHATDIIVVLFV